MPHTVLVSASSGEACPVPRGLGTGAPSPGHPDDVEQDAIAAGFAVQRHTLGSAPSVNFSQVAVAIVEVAQHHEVAAAQTRRWRAELGDEHLPIVWLLTGFDEWVAARGLEAGADAILSRPLDANVLQAQLRSAVRSRIGVSRVAARAAEARMVGDQLNRTFTQIDREHDLTRRVRLALLQQTFPDVKDCRFAVSHRPRGRNGGDFYAVKQLDANRVVFLVGDVIGQNTASGLLGKFLTEAVFSSGNVSAGALLAEANLALLRLKLDDSPLVALVVGVLNAETGAVAVARAGLPAPVFVPLSGEAEVWAVPGPFLGVAETSFVSHSKALKPGDKLLVGTDGTRPDGDPGPSDDTQLLEAAMRHRTLAGQRFIDAIATDLLGHVQHDDDVTLLSVELEPR